MAQSAGLVWERLWTWHRRKNDIKNRNSILFLSNSDIFYLLIVGVHLITLNKTHILGKASLDKGSVIAETICE